jgi:predicted nucleic acid-binding protein
MRTFLDTGVLIAGARGSGEQQEKVLRIFEDSDRVFVASPFLYLELMPKAIFNKSHLERTFYEKYFRGTEWVKDVAGITVVAQREAEVAGLGALDALHLAAAHLAQADEFITTEKPGKSIHRSSLVKVVYLYR